MRARLEHCTDPIQLESCIFHRLVSVQGTVVRVSPMTVHDTCWLGQGCRNQRSFVPLRSSKSTICVDRQMLRIQEADDEDGGRVTRTVDCKLLADLCDLCGQGNGRGGGGMTNK